MCPNQLVDLSAAQDVEAGDGTTSVVVLAGSLLGAAEQMLQKGIHPTIIAESFLKAAAKAVEYLTEISTPIDLKDKGALLRAATTSLNSKVGLCFARSASVLMYMRTDCISVLLDSRSNCCPSRHSASHSYFLKCRLT